MASGPAYNDFANIFTADQRINAGVGVNVAPGATGEIKTSAGLFERSRSVALGEWQTYTPTWSATSGSNSLGNGTLAGRYTLIGKTCFFQVNLVFGSTTTGSAGVWKFSLPFTANTSTRVALGPAYGSDAGVADYMGSALSFETSSATNLFVLFSAGSLATATTPFTWGNTDFLVMSGAFETT